MGINNFNNEDFKMEDIQVNHHIPGLLLLMVLKGKFYYKHLIEEDL